MTIRPILLCSALLLTACGDKEGPATENENDGQPTIATVNYPLAYFAERLAGDFATIVFDAPADEDPAFWTPSDEDIAAMQKADLILMNGATYAKWAATTSLPFEAVVDTSASFAADFIKVEEAVTHSHGKDDEEHSHGGTAFTTWMDLKQAAAQASAVATAISEEWPDHKDKVQENLATLLDDLKDMDAKMTAATDNLKDAPVIASHPVYQYWERAYGLKVPSLLWEPEMDLGDAELAELRKLMEENAGAKFFVWEGDPLPGHIEALKGLGLTSLVVSPCGNRPESGDFLSVMEANVAAINAVTAQ